MLLEINTMAHCQSDRLFVGHHFAGYCVAGCQTLFGGFRQCKNYN